jgi:hypothetical protein
MKRPTAWLAGFLGGAAVYRLFKRAPEPVPATAPDPAEALKAKLAESKETVESAPAPATEQVDVESRRASVHDEARAAIDEMNAGE